MLVFAMRPVTNNDQWRLVSATDEDEEFADELYFETRVSEFQAIGWPEEQIRAFLKMQSGMQRNSYAMNFPNAVTSMIVVGNEKVGRVIVDRSESEIHLLDIAIVRNRRNGGVGGSVIRALIGESLQSSRPLRLSVERNNDGAFRLYRRLGFVEVGGDSVYLAMEFQRTEDN